ncbi:cyclic nucleotide-gated cation channel alpha-4 [Neolamprologus brichardi]|uniref:cyclic nucleotide-gated cation channel alpha-4 n=1 Tax=Neolamprologus brichardi TaxID=32507 RepID=UPI0003EBF271|nr:cyclic nucleotide-gated cation channel alpha-4 [Neolamprologus brichardi]
MTLPIVYNWVIIILRTCFTMIALSYLPVWLTLDYVSDLMYMIDMIITLHTGYLDQGILVKDLIQLRKRYLRSKHFLWDLASILPFDFLYFAFGFKTPLVRINRLLRIPRLNEALDRMETRTSYPNTFRIAKLMIYIFVLIHWNTCLYFALSSSLGFGSDPWVYPNITDTEFGSMRRQYFYCFWFSAQILTTVGDIPHPEREEEFMFMIADLLIAVLVFASIVGNVGNVVTSLRDRDNVFFPNHELRKGDVGHEMYIIKEGKLAVVADDGVTEFAVLSDGNFFGEISILNIKGNKSGNRRTANIRSNGYSDLFSLSKEDLTDVLSEFPAAKRHLEEKGRQILTKMGMLEESGEKEEGEGEKVETKIKRLENNLEVLQTKLARLMMELESSNHKMQARVAQLELEVSELETQVSEDDGERDRTSGRGQGVGREAEWEREEAEGEEEEEEEGSYMKGEKQGHRDDSNDVTKEGDGESTKSTKEDAERVVEGDKCRPKNPDNQGDKSEDDGETIQGDDRPGKEDGAEIEPENGKEAKSGKRESEEGKRRKRTRGRKLKGRRNERKTKKK